jgi:hypothetical protein
MSGSSLFSFDDLLAYPQIERAIRNVHKAIDGIDCEVVLYNTWWSSRRKFTIAGTVLTTLNEKYTGCGGRTTVEAEKQFHFYSRSSLDPEQHKGEFDNCFKQDGEVEIDYYAFIKPITSRERERKSITIEEQLLTESPWNRDSGEWVSEDTTEQGAIRRKVALFEITNYPDPMHKIAQLERDLAIVLKRELLKARGLADDDKAEISRLSCNTERIADFVAAAGISYGMEHCRSATIEALKYPDADEYFPLVMSLHRKKRLVILCHQLVPNEEIGSQNQLNAAHSIIRPTSFWVVNSGYPVAFKVSPAERDVEGLKKAIKAEIERNEGGKVNALKMKVLLMEKECEVDAPLSPNTAKNPYVFTLH